MRKCPVQVCSRCAGVKVCKCVVCPNVQVGAFEQMRFHPCDVMLFFCLALPLVLMDGPSSF